ncbi:hypothetical protein [Paractinoplanes globisporus]|uniref:Uncharacterized protein n=1 Tax=Paractinoplanes globisporus TaxID=113565 RepID=A0ABW6WEA8_9ACTN|nr:hypothetical protein [Actinoplanes globisporus]
MAFRTSVKLVGVALGVAALAGASQLGLAYGLGIMSLTRALDITMRDHWTAQLAWVAWFAMSAAVVGGMAARRHLPRGSGAGTRLVTAVAAAIGSAAIVPLTMQPARNTHVDGVQPVVVIGICAALGAAAGIFAAYAALSRAVARWSFGTVGIAVWVVALVSVAPALAPGKINPSVRLGVFEPDFLSAEVVKKTALFTMPVLALICGIAVGLTARRRGLGTLAIALAGLAGPALLTAAYLIAGPGASGQQYQTVPYWAAMTAAGAGVLGSVLAAVLRRTPAGSAPTPDRPALPKRDAQPDSAIAQAAASAAQRPDDQLRPSDTGVFSMKDLPSFDGFTPAQSPQAAPPQAAPPQVVPPQVARGRARTPRQQQPHQQQQQSDNVAEWVSGLGNG